MNTKLRPLITVVVPVYNVEKYLNRCIDSICNQSYKNLEIILVDDGSTDYCGRICDNYQKKDTRISVIHQINKGLSEARNAGIDVATGKYIAFIDSDDYIAENMIEVLYTNMKKNGADISCCGHTDIYERSGNRISSSERKMTIMSSKEALGIFLFTRVVDVVAWNKLYNIVLFDNIRYTPGKLYEDHFTTYKLLDKASKIVHTTEPLYFYCKRGSSIGGSSFTERDFELKEALDIECSYIIEKYPDLKRQLEVGYIIWMMVLYDKMLLADTVDAEFLGILKKKIRSNLINIIKFKDISFSKKIQLLLVFCNKYLYYKVYGWYLKKYR